MKKSRTFQWWMLALWLLMAIGLGVIWWSIAQGSLLPKGLRNPRVPIMVTRGHCFG